jgi:hypothetical protein
MVRKNGFASIGVSVFNSDLVLAAQTELSTGSAPIVTAVEGTPSGEGFLVAWTEQAAADFSVHLARVDCRPEP